MYRVTVFIGALLLSTSTMLAAQDVEVKYDRFSDRSSATVRFKLPSPKDLRSLEILVTSEWAGSVITPDSVSFGAVWASPKRISMPSDRPLQCIIDDDRYEFLRVYENVSTSVGAVMYIIGVDGLASMAHAKEIECRAGSIEFSIDENGMQQMRRLHETIAAKQPG